MAVKEGATLGWTRGNVAATIRLVEQQQRDEIAARVRAEMVRQGFTNRKLSDDSGLSEKTISRLINAQKDSRIDTLERVARALGIKDLGVWSGASVSRLDQIERRVNDLHALFFGERGEGGIADRLLRAAEPPPNEADEPPENSAEGRGPRNA